MRLVMLVHNPARRGTYWRAYYLARELCRRGHRVSLLCTAPAGRRGFVVTYEEQGRLALIAAPDLLSGGLRAGWEPWAVLARTGWLQMADCDLIHAFECRPAVILPALFTARRRGLPLVIDWCDWFGRGGSVEERPDFLMRTALRPLETFFEERFRRFATATTVINTVLGRKAIALGVDPATITLLPNGCDLEGWPAETQATARTILGLPADQPLIGYVGVIFARDAALLARAFDQLHEQQPDVRLLVIGYCNSALEELVGNRRAVIRTGPLDTITLRRYLLACDLGWAPMVDSGANRGRWPLKLSTYMEAGRPFVTTTVGDLPAFLARRPVGLAVAPEPAAIAQASAALLNDRQERQRLGDAGHALAAGELNWVTIAAQVEAIYQELIKT